jgi:hypothetical protein
MQSVLSNVAHQRFGTWSLVLVVFCSWGWQATGQTKGQLEAKYKEIIAFEVRPGILAFSTFTADGRVCRMAIEKTPLLDAQHSDFDDTIPSTLVTQLVDAVVPPSERGKPAKYLNSESFIAGGAALIKQDYENVSVTVYGSAVVEGPNRANVIIINWTKRACPS